MGRGVRGREEAGGAELAARGVERVGAEGAEHGARGTLVVWADRAGVERLGEARAAGGAKPVILGRRAGGASRKRAEGVLCGGPRAHP